jgi:hypothetical protein
MTLPVKVGSKIRNNDPRANGKIETVIAIVGDGTAAFDKNYAVYQGATRRHKVRCDRIAEGGNNNNQGWTCVDGLDVT